MAASFEQGRQDVVGAPVWMCNVLGKWGERHWAEFGPEVAATLEQRYQSKDDKPVEFTWTAPTAPQVVQIRVRMQVKAFVKEFRGIVAHSALMLAREAFFRPYQIAVDNTKRVALRGTPSARSTLLMTRVAVALTLSGMSRAMRARG